MKSWKHLTDYSMKWASKVSTCWGYILRIYHTKHKIKFNDSNNGPNATSPGPDLVIHLKISANVDFYWIICWFSEMVPSFWNQDQQHRDFLMVKLTFQEINLLIIESETQICKTYPFDRHIPWFFLKTQVNNYHFSPHRFYALFISWSL